jgi:WD40 repeat protein
MRPCLFRCCPGVADQGEGEGRGRMSGVNVPQSAWSPDDPFAGHPGPVPAVAVTPDGRQIVTGGDDGTARLWDRTSGQLQTTLTGQPRPVTAVAVTPDGRQRLPSTEAAP